MLETRASTAGTEQSGWRADQLQSAKNHFCVWECTSVYIRKICCRHGTNSNGFKIQKNPEAEAAASAYEHKPPSATPSQKHTAAERVASSGVSQSKLYISGAAQPH